MNIEIPVAPLGVLTVLGFLAPYAIAALNGVLPFVSSALARKLVSVVVSVVLAVVGLVLYHLLSSEPWPDSVAAWAGYSLLVLVVCQASYALVTRDAGASKLEQKVGGEGDDAKAARHVARANGR